MNPLLSSYRYSTHFWESIRCIFITDIACIGTRCRRIDEQDGAATRSNQFLQRLQDAIKDEGEGRWTCNGRSDGMNCMQVQPRAYCLRHIFNDDEQFGLLIFCSCYQGSFGTFDRDAPVGPTARFKTAFVWDFSVVYRLPAVCDMLQEWKRYITDSSW